VSLPSLLLQHFDRVTESDLDVSRLRGFILDIAVRGRLVPQDSSEQPARELLQEIQADKARVVGSNNRRSSLGAVPASPTQLPFVLPHSWVWVRLDDVVTKLTDGTHHSPPNLAKGPFKYVTAKNIKAAGVSLTEISYVSAEVHQDIYARCNPEFGDVLYIKDGATTGVVTVNDLHEPFSMLSSVALLKLPRGIFNYLLVAFLRSPFFYDQMRGEMKGSALPRVTLTRMAPALLPLPPLAEQRRIVAKVDELMVFCDQLEAAQAEREFRRDGLRAATLHRFASDGDQPTSAADVQFFLYQSSRLITRPEHLEAVRQTIVDMAVLGKLTSARPISDHVVGHEPGSDRHPVIPAGWQFVCLDDLEPQYQNGASSRGDPSGVPTIVLRLADIEQGRISLGSPRRITLHPASAAKYRVKAGDILIIRVNGSSDLVGRFILSELTEAVAYCDHFIRLRLSQNRVLPQFLRLVGESVLLRRQISSLFVTTAGQKTVNQHHIGLLAFPLPPLTDQHRIVARVDELMEVCDELGAALASAQDKKGRLLEALLYETLNLAQIPGLVKSG